MFRFFLLFYLLHGCWTIRPPPNKLITITTNCTRDTFNLNLNMGKPFKGIVFTKDFADECKMRGDLTSTVNLTIPVSGCGVRSKPGPDGMMEVSVLVVIQMDGKLRQSADVVKLAKCSLPPDMMSMNVMTGMEKKTNRNGRMRFEAKAQPRIRVWLELDGPDGTGAVEVGQSTTLGVRALLPGTIGVRVVDCAALDGLGESSQKLLDDRGCPVDEQVMPALLTRLRPAEEGWSKPHEDDLVEKLFTATFPAFKFPDRERLHVSCGVQLCKGNCPKIDCKLKNVLSFLENEKQLARIEVFNSLAVTAPMIDLDRLQNDRRANITDDLSVNARRIKSDGTLCLSTSNLALAFCILGLIFLIAVVVAVCCLIKGRARNKALSIKGSSVFSMSSSSTPQSRFGNKLLIPYSGATLPYGRVY